MCKIDWTKGLNREIAVSSCKICLLSKNSCKGCNFAFALKVIELEKIELQKDIEELNSIGDEELESLFETCFE